MSFDDRQDKPGQFRRSPTGPRVAPPRQPANPAAVTVAVGRRRNVWSVVIFILLFSSFGIRAYRDLSRPDAWAYWKDQYLSPSLTSSLVSSADFDGGGRGRPVLFIRGKIGAAAASWFRDRLDEAHFAAGVSYEWNDEDE